ncbi:MAG: SRPBCC family protein [Micromonosporaceae bacterium]|nr:SRPBCC family protein [Micromonosporaceae bacterium]
MTAPGRRRRLTGQFPVALPPEEAYRLFSPRGEQAWAHGWSPQFPAPAADDTAPGTVFTTDAHHRSTTWIVVDSAEGRRIIYARVTDGMDAGTVTVTLEGADGGSTATVTYDLSALTEAGERHLVDFAGSYPEFLQSWQDAISASLAKEAK